MSYLVPIYRDTPEGEIEISVRVSIFGSHRPATRDDPAEYPLAEIEEAWDAATGAPVTLTPQEQERACEKAGEAKQEWERAA